MKKIVLIESDENFGSSIKHHLIKMGYAVEHVNRPCGVSTTLKRFMPDIVLTDLLTAGTEGKCLPCMLRESCKDSCPYKLVLLSSADESVQKKMMEDGTVDGCISKDMPLDQITKALESLL